MPGLPQLPPPFSALAYLEPHGAFWLSASDEPPDQEVAEQFVDLFFDYLETRLSAIYPRDVAPAAQLIGCGLCADPRALVLQFDEDSDGIFPVPPLPPTVGGMVLVYDTGLNLVAAGADMLAGVVVPRGAAEAVIIDRDGGRQEHEDQLRWYADAITSGLIAAREELFHLMPGGHDLCVVAGTGLAKDGLTLWKTLGIS